MATLNSTGLTFNNTTTLESRPISTASTHYYNGYFWQQNVAIPWSGDTLVTSTIQNNATRYAYASGKKLIVSKVAIAERLSALNENAATLNTSHTAVWVVELYDGTNWKSAAASFNVYNSGTYYGGSYGIPRSVHLCNVWNPLSTSADGTWTSPLVDPLTYSASELVGYTLTSDSILLRIRFWTLDEVTSPFRSAYLSSTGTLSRVSSIGTSTSGSAIWNPSDGGYRGEFGFNNPNGTTLNRSYLKMQNLPQGVVGSGAFFDINLTQFMSTNVSVTNSLAWHFACDISFTVGEA